MPVWSSHRTRMRAATQLFMLPASFWTVAPGLGCGYPTRAPRRGEHRSQKTSRGLTCVRARGNLAAARAGGGGGNVRVRHLGAGSSHDSPRWLHVCIFEVSSWDNLSASRDNKVQGKRIGGNLGETPPCSTRACSRGGWRTRARRWRKRWRRRRRRLCGARAPRVGALAEVCAAMERINFMADSATKAYWSGTAPHSQREHVQSW
jgi:hypothetical protein